MACTCDYSYTCPECQARIDIELEKMERKESEQKNEERLTRLEEGFAELKARLDRITGCRQT